MVPDTLCPSGMALGDHATNESVVLLADTSWWPSSSRLAVALTKAGCGVSAVYPASGHPLRKTSIVQQRFQYSAIRPVESLAAAIEAVGPQIVIPCDDRAVQHLHELYERARGQGESGRKTSELIERSLGAPASHSIVSARYDVLNIAREEGIRVPYTNPIRSLYDLQAWQSEQKFPWVLKADGTWGGHGVKIARNLRDAERYFLNLAKPLPAAHAWKRLLVNRDPFWLRQWWIGSSPAVSVQSYIEGYPANCGVVCWKGKVLAGVSVEVIGAQGLTGSATVVRVVENPEMIAAAERLASRLGLSGFFGLDFMIEEESGVPYLVEMNPRVTPLCHLQLGKGRDLIGALRAQLSGETFPEIPPVTENDMIAYFPQAWHWDRKSELLQLSYHDVPSTEADLVQDLLGLPWPCRSLLARAVNGLRHITLEEPAAKSCVFLNAVAKTKSLSRDHI